MVGEREGRPDPGDEKDLWRVWDAHASRAVWQRVIERGGDQAIAQRALEGLPEVSALQALEVNQQLVELLTGRRWYVMQAAREAGASWSEIGAALGMSKQGAQDWYRRKIELQEQHVGDLHEADRARAVLEDQAAADGPRVGGLTTGGDLLWDPAVGIRCEVAESVLGDLISYAVGALDTAEQAACPDPAEVARWNAQLTEYVMERRSLNLEDPDRLERIIEERGAELRGLTGWRRGGTSG